MLPYPGKLFHAGLQEGHSAVGIKAREIASDVCKEGGELGA